jgi:hypothetical protein
MPSTLADLEARIAALEAERAIEDNLAEVKDLLVRAGPVNEALDDPGPLLGSRGPASGPTSRVGTRRFRAYAALRDSDVSRVAVLP